MVAINVKSEVTPSIPKRFTTKCHDCRMTRQVLRVACQFESVKFEGAQKYWTIGPHTLCYPDSGIHKGNFCSWNPESWALKPVIRNPSFTARNPESTRGIQNSRLTKIVLDSLPRGEL